MKKISWPQNISRVTPLLGTAVLGAIALFPSSVQAAVFDTGPADDNTSSLGNFRIWVDPDFRDLVAGFPGYDPGTFRLTSPTLYDPSTVIGRSNIHEDGDATDIGGTSVGTAGTIVSDGSFSAVPPGFEGPNGTREVHTEVRSLNMTGAGAAVRAGSAFGLPVSPGEVESLSGNSGDPDLDFPAESFFNIFAEVDIPGLGGIGATLFNTDPLLITGNEPLTEFPPKVVYIHGGTEAVNVFFRDDHPNDLWDAGDRFGRLVLAGHGISFSNSDEDIRAFEEIIGGEEPMIVPEEQIPEPATAIASLFIGLGGLFGLKRKQQS